MATFALSSGLEDLLAECMSSRSTVIFDGSSTSDGSNVIFHLAAEAIKRGEPAILLSVLRTAAQSRTVLRKMVRAVEEGSALQFPAAVQLLSRMLVLTLLAQLLMQPRSRSSHLLWL